jgi:hypothetical protein
VNTHRYQLTDRLFILRAASEVRETLDKLHWVTSTLGIVLALGLTRLLATWVALFRARGQARFDCVPIVWAACIFTMLLQYSWALLYLATMNRDWSFARSLAPLAEAMLLFVASALILPSELRPGEDLRSSGTGVGRSRWSRCIRPSRLRCTGGDLPRGR